VENDTWIEYRKLVLSELERLNIKVMEIDQNLNSTKTDIAMLQIKAGLWGAISGVIPGLIAALFFYFKG